MWFTIRKAIATYPTLALLSPHEEPLEKMSTFAPYGNNITGIEKALEPQAELPKNENLEGGEVDALTCFVGITNVATLSFWPLENVLWGTL
jgi:hypothetical protein